MPGYDRSPFTKETISLRSVYIAPIGDHPLLKNGLSLWISSPHYDLGILLLIEHFPLPDNDRSTGLMSGGTLLESLRDAYESYVITPDSNASLLPGYKIIGSNDNRKFAAVRSELEMPDIPGINVDTLTALQKFGAHLGPPKTLTALYRVRSRFVEHTRRGSAHTTIGYPIAIWLDL